MGAFVISKRLDDQYKFEFKSRKGKTILTSIAFELKFECEEEIENLKQNIDKLSFEETKSAGGKYFFKLNLNNSFLAISRKYTTEIRMQKGIVELQKYATTSEMLDFSITMPIFEE